MIWQTANARWLARHGSWRPWLAWHPVSLEPPADSASDQPTHRAWLCIVWRIGVIVRGQRFWLYREFEAMPAAAPEHQRGLRVIRGGKANGKA